MKTTWYLHVHLVWLKLSNSSIVEDLPVCLAAHGEMFFDGHCRKRQTPTASPAKPGELPMGLGPFFRRGAALPFLIEAGEISTSLDQPVSWQYKAANAARGCPAPAEAVNPSQSAHFGSRFGGRSEEPSFKVHNTL